jgi:hypothetical protein
MFIIYLLSSSASTETLQLRNRIISHANMTSLQHITDFAKPGSISRCRYREILQGVAKPHLTCHRGLHQSLRTTKETFRNAPSSPAKPDQHTENPPLSSFRLFQQIREAKPAVRYTIYAGLGLMATLETTFWFNVLRATFFPRASNEEKLEDDELLRRLQHAMKGYRTVWLKNYRRYYGAYVWGMDYGGLNRIDE